MSAFSAKIVQIECNAKQNTKFLLLIFFSTQRHRGTEIFLLILRALCVFVLNLYGLFCIKDYFCWDEVVSLRNFHYLRMKN